MKTDVYLKRLTELSGADLLEVFGLPAGELLHVETLEMPASSRRLDSLLHVRSPNGQEYLHIIEWLGYHDPTVLWRVLFYLAWLGMKYPNKTIVATIVYLTPTSYLGHTLHQYIDGVLVQSCQLHSVRLWEFDPEAAIESGHLGLVILSLLMQGADVHIAERAIDTVALLTEMPERTEYLTILAALAERIMPPGVVFSIIERKDLMESTIISSIVDELLIEKKAELKAELKKEKEDMEREHERERLEHEREIERIKREYERERLERERLERERLERERLERERLERERLERERLERKRLEREWLEHQHHLLIEAMGNRFPDVPLGMSLTVQHDIWTITDTAVLQQLVIEVIKARDLGDFAQVLKTYVASAESLQ